MGTSLSGILSHSTADERIEVDLSLALQSIANRLIALDGYMVYRYVEAGILTSLDKMPELVIAADGLELHFKEVKVLGIDNLGCGSIFILN